MAKRQHTLTVVLALIAGLVGGVVSSWFFVGHTVFAEKEERMVQVITAEEFRVVDKAGKAHAVLGMTAKGETGFWFLNQDGSPRFLLADEETGNLSMQFFGKESKAEFMVFISDKKNNSGIAFGNRDGKSGASLITNENGAPVLSLNDKEGKGRVRLDLVDGRPRLTFLDSTGNPRFLVTEHEDGEMYMSLNDKTLKGAVSLAVTREQGPCLLLNDEHGLRAGAGLAVGLGPCFWVCDRDQKARAQLRVDNQTSAPSLAMMDKNNRTIWSAP